MTQAAPSELTTLAAAARLSTAALVGLAVGIEREWSGHASGPGARFAGLRTFLLIGMLGGCCGLFVEWGHSYLAAALALSSSLFVIASYVMAVRRPEADLDGTTETAALIVLALGALAGIGQDGLAAGAVAVVVFALGEKDRLHWLVQQVGETEMRAALQFAVMALVILPILPNGPYLSSIEFRPRALWTIVVLLSGINFAGYLARRAIGPNRGYGITGMIGGLVSSTAVSLQFSRRSRDEGVPGTALALGVIGACSVLPIRVALVSSVLDARVGQQLAWYLLPPAVAGFLIVAAGLRREDPHGSTGEVEDGSPLRLRSAIQMALLFQAAITAVSLTQQFWGQSGLLASAVVLGLTDVDALTISMTRAADNLGGVPLAALGIAMGIVSNTIFKAAVVLVVGRGRFRIAASLGLAVIGVVLALAIAMISRSQG